MGRERRQFYRVGYPQEFMPKLIIGESRGKKEHREKEYKIVDICERGVKFTSEAEMSGFKHASKIEAQVTFCDGELFVVNGEVLRCSDDYVVIFPSRDLPPSRVAKEQEFVENLHQLDVY